MSSEEKLYTDQQYINLLKLVVVKMRLLHFQSEQSEDSEKRTYLRLAVKPYRVMLGYLLTCKQNTRLNKPSIDQTNP